MNAMTITEKVAYIKGLCAGLELDADKKETKVLNAIIELLEEMAFSISDIEDDIISMGDELDAISDDLSDVEDVVFDDEDYDDDDDCDCCCDDDDDDDDIYDFDEDFFEVECPNCSEKLYVDDGVLEEGALKCPGCGKEVIFQIVDDCEDEDCDCGCHE